MKNLLSKKKESRKHFLHAIFAIAIGLILSCLLYLPTSFLGSILIAIIVPITIFICLVYMLVSVYKALKYRQMSNDEWIEYHRNPQKIFCNATYAHPERLFFSNRYRLKRTRKLAEQGYSDAQYQLARHYYKGDKLPRDTEQAIYWYRKAAINGSARAKEILKLLGIEIYEKDR